jgi:Fanconi-associated nuclease 1
MTQDQLKRYWKRSSLKTAEGGLQDRDCHIIYHYDLQKRIIKLERALKIPRREQHDFGHARLTDPTERNVAGIQVRVISGAVGHGGFEERRNLKTIWVDERDGGECSVESMCLSWYRSQGWKGKSMHIVLAVVSQSDDGQCKNPASAPGVRLWSEVR